MFALRKNLVDAYTVKVGGYYMTLNIIILYGPILSRRIVLPPHVPKVAIHELLFVIGRHCE